MQDATSRRSLFFYLSLLKIAKVKRIPFVIWGGIGPLSKGGKRKVKKILPSADALYLRSATDIRETVAICREVNPKLSPDPAFLLPTRKRRKQNTLILAMKKGTKPPVSAIKELIQHQRLSPIVIAMSAEDTSCSQKLAKKLEAPVFTPQNLSSLTDWLASARLVLASRLHAGILALNCATPTLLLCDGGKCDALVRDISMLTENPPICSTTDKTLAENAVRLLSQPKENAEETHRLLISKIKKAQP